MAKKLPIGNAMVADYVGQGNRRKHTIVNAYSGDIIVGSFPAELGFGLYIEVLKPRGADDFPPHINVTFSYSGKPVFRAQTRAQELGPKSVMVCIIPLFQFVAEEPGDMEVSLSAEGYSKTVAISKTVSQGQID